MSIVDSFGSKGKLNVAGTEYEIFRLNSVEGAENLPFSLKVLLENLLRTEDGANITADHVRALAGWDPSAEPDTEIQFTPARVIMQDFTGVPCVVDLATMREAVKELGGDPKRVNPLAPAEMVIDHSVQIDAFGNSGALERNMEIEYQRNGERYQFLRWGQTAFDDFKVVPPGTGIVHQVNIEYLARTVMTREVDGVAPRLPGHLRRHRLAHHHGQRPGRAGLGRWRHRGRGSHARPARLHADPARCGLQAHRLHPGRRHRHRRRADHHRAAAQARCGRQVRRVLRRRRRGCAAGQPRHHRQHEPGVRLHRRDVPDRRRHPRLPAPHRPVRRERRPRGVLREGTGPLARPLPRDQVLRVPRAGPVHGCSVDLRPEAPAGPHHPHRVQGPVPRGPAQLREGRPGRRKPGRSDRRELPGFGLALVHRLCVAPDATWPRTRTARSPTAARPTRSASRPQTDASSSWTTARSRSPRSPPAPTRPTRP